MYRNHLTILKIDWLLLSLLSAEDRGLFKLAVEETDLSTDLKSKRKQRTPNRLSPLMTRKPKPDGRQAMTAVYSSAFQLFMEDTGINESSVSIFLIMYCSFNLDETANSTDDDPINSSNGSIEYFPQDMAEMNTRSSPISFQTPDNSQIGKLPQSN